MPLRSRSAGSWRPGWDATRLAGELKADARSITDVGGAISSAVGSMTFDGPAADRIRSTTKGATGDMGDESERLTGVAKLLLDSAEEVEKLQKARLEKIAEMRRDYAAQGIPAQARLVTRVVVAPGRDAPYGDDPPRQLGQAQGAGRDGPRPTACPRCRPRSPAA